MLSNIIWYLLSRNYFKVYTASDGAEGTWAFPMDFKGTCVLLKMLTRRNFPPNERKRDFFFCSWAKCLRISAHHYSPSWYLEIRQGNAHVCSSNFQVKRRIEFEQLVQNEGFKTPKSKRKVKNQTPSPSGKSNYVIERLFDGESYWAEKEKPSKTPPIEESLWLILQIKKWEKLMHFFVVKKKRR